MAILKRRHFLMHSSAAAAAGALPSNIRKALAVTPNNRTGTLNDVEHVVILMQENRSFDHYFGTLKGVRGYSDPRSPILPDGQSVFSQSDGKGGRVLPFRFNVAHTSSACLGSLDHSWKGTQAAWNEWDTWVPHKTPMTMGYFTRQDIPYYYALADAFTVCDSYHASLFGPTNPNRLFLFSGTNGLAVGQDGKQAIDNVDDGNWSADMAHDKPDFTPFTWSTYPEALQKAGVSWKVYQEYDNFGDNPLASFAQFRNLSRSSWQYQNARSIVPGSSTETMKDTDGHALIKAFERDVANGTLPQVSWIVPPAALSEHPNAPPGYGEYLISRLMDIFVTHPEVWKKTVFILNYDENDGFFDHVPAPVPALNAAAGFTDVSTQGEVYHGETVGLGPRVPAIIISPWTKGGWVNSELFDHTSVLRFLEQRFQVEVPHLTPWRRSVCGDLTSVFDFSQANPDWQAHLPDTATYLEETRRSCKLPPPLVPLVQTMPVQEQGQKPARAIAYDMTADWLVSANATTLVLHNIGLRTATFRVSLNHTNTRHYTLRMGSAVRIPVPHRHGQTVQVYGQNGFYRFFRTGLPLAMTLRHDKEKSCMVLDLTPLSSAPDFSTVTVNEAYSQQTLLSQRLTARHPESLVLAVKPGTMWYDLTINSAATHKLLAQFSGHCENGTPDWTDPAIGQPHQ
ncbi:phosphocholine-specific phospholipase C [Acetobacter senegalensis]|uniref:phosphocholine-specific phospholipase C n=1 Tax=Acetobacter senegalensis TaxID=446692 RepID=UPI001EDF65C1|nr:phospholipase C, phosphocholine-specific [Acetobacter senegalensis]MCG4273322.1 phospholipase C, phosphocholine-specific [Acetobacter senegalensis]